MKEECLICRAPLEYLEADEMMECALCHRMELQPFFVKSAVGLVD